MTSHRAARLTVPRRVVLVGATGRTGRLVAEELRGRPRVVLVGRDGAAVSTLAAATGHGAVCADLAGLGGHLQPGDVLLSLVGPYDVHGDAVVRAAIHAHATYLDVSGEPAFLRRVFEQHGPEAARAGVSLIPAVGYESLPGIWLAEQVLGATTEPVASVDVAYVADGGLGAGSAGGRRSLVRALTRPTTTFRDRYHHTEPVAARVGTVVAGGRRRITASLGGAEVWAVPARHPNLESVDVHSAWFGPLAPVLAASTRAGRAVRLLGADRLLDAAVAALGDGDAAGLGDGVSRFVAQARSSSGQVIARREAVGGNPIVLAARLAAAVADEVAHRDVRSLPTGATDPVAVCGLDGVTALAGLAGLVTT